MSKPSQKWPSQPQASLPMAAGRTPAPCGPEPEPASPACCRRPTQFVVILTATGGHSEPVLHSEGPARAQRGQRAEEKTTMDFRGLQWERVTQGKDSGGGSTMIRWCKLRWPRTGFLIPQTVPLPPPYAGTPQRDTGSVPDHRDSELLGFPAHRKVMFTPHSTLPRVQQQYVYKIMYTPSVKNTLLLKNTNPHQTLSES